MSPVPLLSHAKNGRPSPPIQVGLAPDVIPAPPTSVSPAPPTISSPAPPTELSPDSELRYAFPRRSSSPEVKSRKLDVQSDVQPTSLSCTKRIFPSKNHKRYNTHFSAGHQGEQAFVLFSIDRVLCSLVEVRIASLLGYSMVIPSSLD